MTDKNGNLIKEGQQIRIKNDRGDINRSGTVEMIDGTLQIKENIGGKYTSVKTWINAIWWRNDKPENFLEIVSAA